MFNKIKCIYNLGSHINQLQDIFQYFKTYHYLLQNNFNILYLQHEHTYLIKILNNL